MEELEDLNQINAIIKQNKAVENEGDFEFEKIIADEESSNEADDPFEEFQIPDFPKHDISKFNTYAPMPFLNEKEKQVIDSCTDPTLKELLLLNRTKNIQLMQLYKNIKDLLIECQDDIAAHEKEITLRKSATKLSPKIWMLGHPYFKTADLYPCPLNEDTLEKIRRSELNYYELMPCAKWDTKNINRLFKVVAFKYKIYKELQFENRLQELSSNDIKADKSERAAVLKELQALRRSEADDYPPLGQEHILDWNRISEYFFLERYSAQDIKTIWKTYLHPHINSGNWTDKETTRLISLVKTNKYQNWEKIAEELGNNRTAFVACVHYFSTVDPPRTGGRFTPEEDKKLIELVKKYHNGDYIPWTKLTRFFPGRTRVQISHRYKYFVSCKPFINVGKFSHAEDILILILIQRFGTNFSKCAEYMTNRSLVQIKGRYTNNLKMSVKKGSFTLEEDQIILDYAKTSGTHSWGKLSQRLSRCGAQIRQRYSTLRSFQLAHPDSNLADAPRRVYTGAPPDLELDYLRLIADRFKDCNTIPTLHDIERLLAQEPDHIQDISSTDRQNKRKSVSTTGDNKRRKQNSSDVVINPIHQQVGLAESNLPSLTVDDLLVEYFSGSLKQSSDVNVEPERIRVAADRVSNILSILKAELHVPTTYAENSKLDAVDKGILEILTNDKPIIDNAYVISTSDSCVNTLLPPTLNTVAGMSSLLVKNQGYKERCAKLALTFDSYRRENIEKQVLWCINTHLSNQTAPLQNRITLERDIFFKRFVSIFKFPAIMSLASPSSTLGCAAKEHDESSKRARSYSKRPKPLPSFKKVFVEVTQGETTSQPTKSKLSTSKSAAPKPTLAEILKKRIADTLKDLMKPPKPKFTSLTNASEFQVVTPHSASSLVKDYAITSLAKNAQESAHKRHIFSGEECDVEPGSISTRKKTIDSEHVKPGPSETYPTTSLAPTTEPSKTYKRKKTKTINLEHVKPGPSKSRICPKVEPMASLATADISHDALILKSDISIDCVPISNQDLKDVQLLDHILAREKIKDDEESFEF